MRKRGERVGSRENKRRVFLYSLIFREEARMIKAINLKLFLL